LEVSMSKNKMAMNEKMMSKKITMNEKMVKRRISCHPRLSQNKKAECSTEWKI
jgi:hypothetical protein